MEIVTTKSQRFCKSFIEAYDNDVDVKKDFDKAIAKRAVEVFEETMETADKVKKYFGPEVNIRVSVTIDDRPLDEDGEDENQD